MVSFDCSSMGIQPPKEAVPTGFSETPSVFCRDSPNEGIPHIF